MMKQISRIEKGLVVILFAIMIISALVMLFVAKPWGDEHNYHYPNSKYFSLDRITEPDSEYSSAYGPLPYLLGKIILFFHDSITYLRILNFVVFLILGIYVFLISRKLTDFSIILTLLIISNPYLLRSAFTYYMFNYGLMFSIVGIYFYFFSTFKYKYLIAHLFFGLAVISQQWMLIIICSIFLLELFRFEFKKESIIKIASGVLVKLLVLLPAFYLFYTWQGLTHPNFRAHSLHPTFEHLNASFANWGFIALFIFVIYFKKYLWKKELIPLLFILPILFLTIPIHSSGHGSEQITGLTAQIATQLAQLTFIPYKITFFIFIISGLSLTVMAIIKRKNNFEYFLFFVILSFLVAFTSSTLLGASHIFVSAPFILLLFQKEIFEHRYIRYFIILQYYFVSLFYIFYWGLLVVEGKSF
ncbi:MAG: hypothetical protein Kow0068_12060 [Marinilabiliales bacterium]